MASPPPPRPRTYPPQSAAVPGAGPPHGWGRRRKGYVHLGGGGGDGGGASAAPTPEENQSMRGHSEGFRALSLAVAADNQCWGVLAAIYSGGYDCRLLAAAGRCKGRGVGAAIRPGCHRCFVVRAAGGGQGRAYKWLSPLETADGIKGLGAEEAVCFGRCHCRLADAAIDGNGKRVVAVILSEPVPLTALPEASVCACRGGAAAVERKRLRVCDAGAARGATGDGVIAAVESGCGHWRRERCGGGGPSPLTGVAACFGGGCQW